MRGISCYAHSAFLTPPKEKSLTVHCPCMFLFVDLLHDCSLLAAGNIGASLKAAFFRLDEMMETQEGLKEVSYHFELPDQALNRTIASISLVNHLSIPSLDGVLKFW